MFNKENMVNLERLRNLTISVLLWKKRNLRNGYRVMNKLREKIRTCDNVIQELQKLIQEEYVKDVVNIERINCQKTLIENTKIDKQYYMKNLEKLKTELVRIENETYEVIVRNGQLLTKNDMIQLTGGHYYNFEKADLDDADGTFLDYVFVHVVECIDSKHGENNLQQNAPLFYACMKAISRSTSSEVFAEALALVQEQQEQKHIEELESKYEVEGKVITLK